jgi:hypothetical protein
MKLILTHPDPAICAILAKSSWASDVETRCMDGYDFARSPDIDALYVSVTAAIERWGGAKPMVGSAQVLVIPSADREEGFPRYAVAGGAVSREEFENPIRGATTSITALFRSVKQFNSGAEPEQTIRSIGLSLHWFDDRLSSKWLALLACAVFRETFSDSERLGAPS